MIRYPDGSVRYFTVRKSAVFRLSPTITTLPAPRVRLRQLGNAVPVHLAEVVASSVQHQLARGRQLAGME